MNGSVEAGTGVRATTSGDGANITLTLGTNGSITGTSLAGADLDTTGVGATITVQGSSGTIIGATDGINATTAGRVITVSTLDLVRGQNGDGIDVTSNGGDITVSAVGQVDGQDTVAPSNAGSAMYLRAGGGNISVQGRGLVGGINGVTNGIDALTSNGGNIDIGGTTANGNIVATGGIGTLAVTDTDGNITIDQAGTILGSGGGQTHGIRASTTNAGTITVSTGGDIGSTTVAEQSTVVGIDTSAGTGQTTITLGGNVWSQGDGIHARSSGGAVEITGTGNVTGGSDVGDDGIDVETGGGDFELTLEGDISGDPGIVVNSGGGDINILGSGNVNGTMEGMLLDAGGGNILVRQDGTVTGGTDGINASTTGTGTIDIQALQDVTGGSDWGIFTMGTSGAQAVSVAFGATVSATSQQAISLAANGGVNNTLTVEGTVLGDVDGGASNEAMTITSTGVWDPAAQDGGTHVSDLGDGDDSIDNGGTIVVADKTNTNVTDVTVTGLETITNTGLIDMQNDAGASSIDTDRLTLANPGISDTTFNGGGTLAVDSFLGADPSPSDLVVIGTAGDSANGGVMTGVTTLEVNDTNFGVPGSFNPIGAEAVRVENTGSGASRSNMELDGGPVDKGFWLYDLFLDDTRANPGRSSADVFVLASVPDQEAQEMPFVVAGAQNAWHETMGMVADR